MRPARSPVFVGRSAESARLGDLLTAATGAEGRAVVVTGEAGIGKTRLVRELLDRCPPGTTVLEGGSPESDLALPFLAFVEAIENHLAAVPARPLGSYRHQLARLVPGIGEPPPVDPSDAPVARLHLFEAVLAFLRDLSLDGPVVLVIEDLHWADSSSRELFDFIARTGRHLSLLLIGTCRPEELRRRHPLQTMLRGWERDGQVEVMRLTPLGAAESAAMVRAITGDGRYGGGAEAALHARSEGNPFVLEELLKSAADSGWDGGGRVGLPETVRIGILERIERSLQGDQAVLEAAAVLGERWSYEHLSQMIDAAPGVLDRALLASIEAQLIEEVDCALGRYAFRHSLVRDAVYEELIAPRRQHLHAAAARVLAGIPGTPLVEICRHLIAARDWVAAAPLCLAAAEEAEAAHGYEEAAELYERALDHVGSQLERGEVLCRLGTCRLQQGDSARARRWLEAGLEILDGIGTASVAGAHHRISHAVACWQGARLDTARLELGRALAVLEKLPAGEDLAMVHVRLAGLNLVELEGAAAVASAETAVAIATEVGADAARIWAFDYLGAGLAYGGRIQEGLEYLDLAFVEARLRGLDPLSVDALYQGILWRLIDFRPGDAMERVRILRSVGGGRWTQRVADIAEAMMLWWGFGEPRPAQVLLENALAGHAPEEENTWMAWAEINLAAVNGQLGRFDAARRLLKESGGRSELHIWMLNAWTALRIGIDSGDPELLGGSAAALVNGLEVPPILHRILADIGVEALLSVGRTDEAGALAASVAEDVGPSDNAALGSRIRGRIALARGQGLEAIGELESAIDGFVAKGMAHEEIRTRAVLARALLLAGRREEAVVQLRMALAGSRRRGLELDENLARADLRALGELGEPTVELVKAALESLDSPAALAASPLAQLRLVAGATGREAEALQALLRELVLELAGAPGQAEREAGRILERYYQGRSGSHERIAESVHLSMGTYYRRLNLGHAWIAGRLRDREAAVTG